MYLHANAVAPTTWANYNHAFDISQFREVTEAIQAGTIRYVVLDIPKQGFTSSILGTEQVRVELRIYLEQCLELLDSWPGGRVFSYPTMSEYIADPTRTPTWVDSTIYLYSSIGSNVTSSECQEDPFSTQ